MPGFTSGLGSGIRLAGREVSDAQRYSGVDDLQLPAGTQFTAQNDLNRLEVTAANQIEGSTRGLTNALAGIGRVGNREGEAELVADAAERAKRASENDKAQFERSTRGLSLTDRQKRAATKRLGLARSLNRAQATGEARRGVTDRAKTANAVGGSFGDALFGAELSGETAIAKAYMTRRAAEAQSKANKKSSTLGFLGTLGGLALAAFSSEKYKDDGGKADNLLSKLRKTRVNKWNYKGNDYSTHIGPFAEEFNSNFDLRTDRPDTISIIDALGVTLGAIKELDEKVSQHG
jgi:hypothetical protein